MTIKVTILAQETLLLREGEDWLRVHCAWGVNPSVAFLPPTSHWDRDLPGWLHGRRPQAVHAIEAFGLVVEDDARPLPPGAFGRGDPPEPGTGQPLPFTTLEAIPIEEFRRGHSES